MSILAVTAIVMAIASNAHRDQPAARLVFLLLALACLVMSAAGL